MNLSRALLLLCLLSAPAGAARLTLVSEKLEGTAPRFGRYNHCSRDVQVETSKGVTTLYWQDHERGGYSPTTLPEAGTTVSVSGARLIYARETDGTAEPRRTECVYQEARADFTGRWRGPAVLTLKDGTRRACDEAAIEVAQDERSFSFGRFRYVCGEFGFSFTPPGFDIDSDGYVSWRGKKVGSVQGGEVKLEFVLAANGKARYTARKVSAAELEYLDEQIEVDPATGAEKITSVRGRLLKAK